MGKTVFAIVVLDRGFVYVGTLEESNGSYKLTEAKNIRRWGTDKGLGQLVLNGPQENTKLDECGNVLFNEKALISVHPTDQELWTKK